VKQIPYELLKNQLKRHEGLMLHVYKCPAGKLTVGIGRNLEDKGITEEEALYLLDNDIQECRDRLKGLSWYRDLDDVRKCVIINMCFNLGYQGLLKFKNMIKYIKKKEYHKAVESMRQSKWCSQVGERAQDLMSQMLSGFFKEQLK